MTTDPNGDQVDHDARDDQDEPEDFRRARPCPMCGGNGWHMGGCPEDQ